MIVHVNGAHKIVRLLINNFAPNQRTTKTTAKKPSHKILHLFETPAVVIELCGK